MSSPRATLTMRTPVLRVLECLPADQAARLGGERRVEREEVGSARQLLEALDVGDAELGHPLRGHVGVEGERRAWPAPGPGARPAGRSGRSRRGRASCPRSSTPANRERSQRPSFSAACACGIERASASRSPIVCSAAETTFDWGAFTTRIPRFVAAATSTLSTPTPARPITFSRVACSISSRVTRVALRTTRASYDARSAREVAVECRRRRRSGRRSSSTPASAICSRTRHARAASGAADGLVGLARTSCADAALDEAPASASASSSARRAPHSRRRDRCSRCGRSRR